MSNTDVDATRMKGRRAMEVASPPPRPPEGSSAAGEGLSARVVGEVEAVVFSAERAVSASRLAAAVFRHGKRGTDDASETSEPTATKEELAAVRSAIESLNEAYAGSGRAFRIEAVAGGYRVMTLGEYAEAVASFKRLKQGGRLSKAAVEALAIIAYRQPVTRAELEAIRGVGCGEVLKSLLERRLVTITGRAEELGRPMLYGTTKQFLDQFGLSSIKDLPSPGEFKPV